MVITYGGLEFFKVQSGNLTIVFNPPSKDSKSGITTPRFQADIALVSFNHPDFNGTGSLSGKGEKDTFIIDGPGEYEIQEVFIKGFKSVSHYDGKEKINTIYKVVAEGINLCFLGSLDTKDVGEKILGEVDDTEILFVPISGDGVLNAADAYKLSVKISPNVIIPMYSDSKASLDKFLKEEGAGKILPIEKLTTKKGLLATKSGEIVVLDPTSK